jgi:hypothetical protein
MTPTVIATEMLWLELKCLTVNGLDLRVIFDAKRRDVCCVHIEIITDLSRYCKSICKHFLKPLSRKGFTTSTLSKSKVSNPKGELTEETNTRHQIRARLDDIIAG